MKIIHTADWHIGRLLYGRKRHTEHGAFLEWLLDTIRENAVDAVVVAGDVFDTPAPGNRSQELYYQFVANLSATGCRQLVIVGGNHDSPSFLDAPSTLLKHLNVHVVGQARKNPEDEVFVLRDPTGQPAAIVCAVPFLRDRDVRESEAGEGQDDKDSALLRGIAEHYRAVVHTAVEQSSGMDRPVALIGTGHLYSAGGSLREGDGVRDLYIGSLGRVPLDCFPAELDYVALGHLHVPQKVGPTDRVRYSGSPIPLGFGEAGQTKSVCLLELNGRSVDVRLIEVPVFQRMESIRGPWDAIHSRLLELVKQDESLWVEVILEGNESVPDLSRQVQESVADSQVEVLRIKHERQDADPWDLPEGIEELEDIRPEDVFVRCLDSNGFDGEQRDRLMLTFRQVLSEMAVQDPGANG